MATTRKTKAKTAEARKDIVKSERAKSSASGSGAPDVIELLTADHEEVSGWLEAYEGATNDAEKTDLAGKICLALTVHARIEEELFYPPAREATKDDDLLDEAEVEHAGAKHLIAEIEAMTVGDDLYDAKIKVLSEYIRHHVKEEEQELFPEVRASDLDLSDLGKKLADRKEQLMTEMSKRKAA